MIIKITTHKAISCFTANKAVECYEPLIPVKLNFFEGEKTEKASTHKKQKAREEGQVAKSTEVGTALLFISMFFSLRVFAGYMYNRIAEVFIGCLSLISDYDDLFSTGRANALIVDLFIQIMMITLPIFAVAMVVGVAVNFAQVGWHPTSKPLMPKFSKLDPLKGIKRLFSVRSLLELFKSLLKLGIIIYVIYNGLIKEVANLLIFIDLDLAQGVAYISNVIVGLGLNVGFAYLAIAAIDYAYTRYKHAKDLRMSKQDIADEYKQTEGNPQIKGRIKQKMREASMRRMMGEVPQADVIITNPTHYAVALKYDMLKSGSVPIVVAKGVDHLAKRIKDLAKENGVAIVENKPLARTLYATVDVGREIPPELYAAVAEILSYVYKLKKAV